MDSQKDDRERESRRPDELARQTQQEEALARRLAKAFDEIGTQAAGHCPDPEQIAAYHEHALSPEESSRCENHFSICTRCRTISAVLAASGSETPLADLELTRLGLLVAQHVPKEPAPAAEIPTAALPVAQPQPRRQSSRTLRWLIPAVGVAAVLAIWFAVRPPWRQTQTLVAQAPAPASPDTGGADVSAIPIPKDAQLQGDSAPPPTLPPANPAAPESVPKQPPASKLDAQVDNLIQRASDYTPPDNSANAASAARLAPPAPAASAARQAPAAQPAPRAGAAATQRQPAPASDQAVAENRSVAEAPVNGKNLARAPANAPVGGLVSGAFLAPGFSAVLKSPSSALVSWRAGAAGRIERSADGGRTWQAQQSPVKDDWLAGSAVSDTICWLVGRNGAVARTTDGQTWEPIAAPSFADNSGSRPDWISVSASDADTAILVARDQQRYLTQDGGRTWQKQ